jgi:hypothetical protein
LAPAAPEEPGAGVVEGESCCTYPIFNFVFIILTMSNSSKRRRSSISSGRRKKRSDRCKSCNVYRKKRQVENDKTSSIGCTLRLPQGLQPTPTTSRIIFWAKSVLTRSSSATRTRRYTTVSTYT